MAILQEPESPEPLSKKGAEKTKVAFSLSNLIQPPAGWSLNQKIKNQSTRLYGVFLSFSRNFLFGKKQAGSASLEGKVPDAGTRLSQLKSVFDPAALNRYLPHVAITALSLIVIATNWHDKAAADTIYDKLIYVEPAAQFSIIQRVDEMTPLISNDADLVHKLSASSGAEDGFVSATGPVETAITAREEPLPDNSTKTVMYTVKNGDTLTGIGWKFGVKMASLKYVNNLDTVDVIKPGSTLKIPPTGYEVPATLIAKQEKDKKTKLALANSRSTIARAASSSRLQAGNADGYVGTIDGVKYVRRAKSNESQCYTYVTSQGYKVGGYLLAKWIPTNSNQPRVGGLVVTYESWAGHVAVVTGVNGDGTFNIRESNYTSGWITERTMSINNGKIKGFVN